MKTCEPWAVAAVCLMQSVNGREHYTDIVNYILDTELTELTEKGVVTTRTATNILNQKVINNRAIFDTDGNGYYSLNDAAATLKEKDVQDVIESLQAKNLEVNLCLHKDEENKPVQEDEVLSDDVDRLSDDMMKLRKLSEKLSNDAKRLGDETIKLSDEVIKLTDEKKTLHKEIRRLQAENEDLNEKLQSVKQLCEF